MKKAPEEKKLEVEETVNARMDVRSYEAGQDKKLMNKGDNEMKVGDIAKIVQERRLQWYGACDEKGDLFAYKLFAKRKLKITNFDVSCRP